MGNLIKECRAGCSIIDMKQRKENRKANEVKEGEREAFIIILGQTFLKTKFEEYTCYRFQTTGKPVNNRQKIIFRKEIYN